jgi:uncharacterized protein (UPF0333 family)
MGQIKPAYKALLLAAVVMWVISMSYYVANLYLKVGRIEHALIHVPVCLHGN